VRCPEISGRHKGKDMHPLRIDFVEPQYILFACIRIDQDPNSTFAGVPEEIFPQTPFSPRRHLRELRVKPVLQIVDGNDIWYTNLKRLSDRYGIDHQIRVRRTNMVVKRMEKPVETPETLLSVDKTQGPAQGTDRKIKWNVISNPLGIIIRSR
jgi:hypothetical protein